MKDLQDQKQIEKISSEGPRISESTIDITIIKQLVNKKSAKYGFEEANNQFKKIMKHSCQQDSLMVPTKVQRLHTERNISFSQRIEMPGKQESLRKKALILFTSGSAGANENLEIVRGMLKSKISQNQYLSDYKMQENLQDKSFLITPEQQNGVRILYKVQEFRSIPLSINVTLDIVKQIATCIFQNYKKYDAFIILSGLDAICTISTIISFMLENLSKLVIFTGGYFPISYMRNDIVNNLIESFAVISMAQNFNDVIIISRNKGYRGNRSIKMWEGELGSVSSPNLSALVSVNIKINFRQHLFLPAPKEEFHIWTHLSQKVGVIKFHILLSKEALEYELNNPAYQGFVVESYASNNLPDNIEILNLFKKAAEQKGKIFVSVAQSVMKANNSLKKDYLQQFHIFFGGDMTTEAASAKLSYLLSKNYSRNQIKKFIHTDMRGELTEVKRDEQFSLQNFSFMEIVTKSIDQFYPTNYHSYFINKIEDEICKFVVRGSTYKEIEQLFKKVQVDEDQGQEIYKKTMIELINRNYLLHKAVEARNEYLYKYFLGFNISVNQLDDDQCSALYYAVILRDKKTILYLSKKGGNVVCPTDELFEMISRALQEDDWQFLELLYHIEFKETLRQEINIEGRNALHLAAILGAQKCIKYLQKFKFNVKEKDIYGKTFADYRQHN